MYPSHQYPPQGPVYNYPAGPPPMTRTSYRGWLIGAGVVFVAVRIGVNASTACEEAEMTDQEFRSRVIVYVDYQKGCMDGLSTSEI